MGQEYGNAAVRPPEKDVQTQSPVFDVEAIRRDFPLIHGLAGNKPPLVYLDNAASTQKPQVVIDTLTKYYALDNANIHRGVHFLSQRATDAYEAARSRIRAFLNAREDAEVIFTRGTTESINLVASSYARPRLQAGKNIVLTQMEHHANIVPWQLAIGETGAEIRVTPIDERGVLDEEAFEKLIDENTVIAAFTHTSNALGTITPAKRLIAAAHAKGVPVLLDAAQSAPHLGIDVQDLDCDFLAFSGHKIYGPTGIGVLYGRRELLSKMPPYQGGGDMINKVSFEKTTFKDIPERFEAGTPGIAGAIGLAAAIDYVSGIGLPAIAAWEHELLEYATELVQDIPGLRLIGTAPDKASVLSFVIEDIHPHDLGTFLDSDGVAVRAGHHCAQPLMKHLGIPGTLRASFSFYNTKAEAEHFAASLRKVVKFFA